MRLLSHTLGTGRARLTSATFSHQRALAYAGMLFWDRPVPLVQRPGHKGALTHTTKTLGRLLGRRLSICCSRAPHTRPTQPLPPSLAPFQWPACRQPPPHRGARKCRPPRPRRAGPRPTSPGRRQSRRRGRQSRARRRPGRRPGRQSRPGHRRGSHPGHRRVAWFGRVCVCVCVEG